VSSSTIGSVLESFLRAGLGAYSQAGWECAIEWNWERPQFGFNLVECTMTYSIKRT
jgi:hypothetical protein